MVKSTVIIAFLDPDNMGIAARVMHLWVSETDISPEVVLSGGHFEI